MSFLFDRLISPFFEILRGNYYVPRSDWRLEAVQLQLQSEKKSLQHRVANSDWKWLTILRPKKPKSLKFEDKKDWQSICVHVITCIQIIESITLITTWKSVVKIIGNIRNE